MSTVSTQLSQLRTRFKKDPNAKVISDAQLLVFLNEAQDMIETQVVLPAMQTNSTITLVADQQEYSLDSSMFKPVLFRYTANDLVLKQQSFLSIQKRFNDSTGTPEEYYIFGNKIGFYPTPTANEADGVKYWYLKTLDTLVESGAGSGEATTSEIPVNYHWVLERGAEMLAFQMIGDFDRAQQAEIKYNQGIQSMIDRYAMHSDNYDSTLFTLDEMEGERDRLWNPYAT